MADFPNVISYEDQGLELLKCNNCGAIYTDLKRKNRVMLCCTYCGWRFGKDVKK